MGQELAKRWQDSDENLYGLVKKEFLQIGFKFADLSCRSLGFNKEKKLNGEDGC